ncbi:MAG TPA: hypothetical protein VM284_06745 [Candidatus Limnocylindria bacterium]|nr:hypothetical protein [Candidatus Limnocylindria bacterium]
MAGLLLIGLIGGCYQEPVAITTFPPTDGPATFDPNQTPPATLPPSSAGPTADCVNGWSTPEAGSVQYDDALSILGEQLNVDGPWQLDAMRYFPGPDGALHWYMRGAVATDANFRGRFLIEASGEDARVAAVAPYESSGFQSPDWTGFIGDSEPQTYLGLPGRWSGSAYDFVSGGGVAPPGLSAELIGCVSDT